VSARDNTPPDKALRQRLLTVYGRKPVLESLRNPDLDCRTLHLADSNRASGIIGEIDTLARSRGLPVRRHSRRELARISRNTRQDQGVALDIFCPAFRPLDEFLDGASDAETYRLLAVDGITNPRNLGMVIRSAAAGAIDGLVIARRGNAALGPLVIKASAGAVFRAPILTCNELPDALDRCRAHGAEICILDGAARQSLFAHHEAVRSLYVLGNESEGVSAAAAQLAQRRLSIPMRAGVESLNVAVAASLIAYAPYFER